MEPTAPTVPEASSHIDLKLAAIGAVSGIVAAMVMNVFSRTLGSFEPPRVQREVEPDASVDVGTAAFRTVAGYTPGHETRQWLGTAAHYAFSAAVGANYLLASERAPELRRGYGTVYGSLVWATAEETAAPALGLSKPADRVPLGAHAHELAAHRVYGATLEGCRRLASSIVKSWEDSRGVIDLPPSEA